jgi:heat shock protein HslJ
VTENGEPKALVAGTRIQLSFGEDGQVHANAGCNQMGGAGRLRNGQLSLTDLSMTEMACPDGRMEQDTWVADFLTGSPSLDLDGDELTLHTSTITMVLLDRRIADPDRPLTGTRWVVDTIYHGDAASSVPQDAPAVLVLERPGSFTATTGCVGGEMSGDASLDIGRVTFAATAQTPCIGPSNALDEAIRSTLDGARTYEITAGRLRLMSPDGTGLGLLAED